MTVRQGPVEGAHARYVDAKKDLRSETLDGRAFPSQIAERPWKEMANALRAYSSRENNALSGPVVEQFPPEMALDLAFTLEALLEGIVPPSVHSLLSRRGAPGVGPVERHDIETALLYIAAAERGMIYDKTPKKTIREMYSVTGRTVRLWSERHKVDLDHWNPHWSNDQRGELIHSKVFKSAERYRKLGRSTNAILKRDSKRQP